MVAEIEKINLFNFISHSAKVQFINCKLRRKQVSPAQKEKINIYKRTQLYNAKESTP